jgi:hypothetical protein
MIKSTATEPCRLQLTTSKPFVAPQAFVSRRPINLHGVLPFARPFVSGRASPSFRVTRDSTCTQKCLSLPSITYKYSHWPMPTTSTYYSFLGSTVESSEQRTIWNFSFSYYSALQIETISWTTNYVMKLSTARLFNKRQALSTRCLSCHQNPNCCEKQRWGREDCWFVMYIILSTRFEDFTQALLNIQVCWFSRCGVWLNYPERKLFPSGVSYKSV